MVELCLDAVGFAYPGGEPVLRDVHLALSAGELVCVIGPNGAGKTTLLRAAGGLLSPTAGSVTLDGRDVKRFGSRERARRIAFVPQGLRTVPEFVVADFVLGGRYGHLDAWRGATAHDRDVCHEALREADVADLGDRVLTRVSGGQMQRVLIARALAQEADCLLVDEPTSSLDPEHQLSIFGLLARLVREGRSGLVVTHDLNLASQFASRVVLLAEGRTVADGPPDTILTPEVLGPVYGTSLRFGSWPTPAGERPFVVPWAVPER